MYGCESWTIKKAEYQRIDAFELRCWRILLRVPWTARGSNQSILKEINPEFSLEGLMLKLKLQYFGHLIHLTLWKRPWCWERLKVEGEEDDRGWDGWMASLTQWTWVWVNSGSWWWTGRPGMPWFMGSQRVGHDWVIELSWNEWRNWIRFCFFFFIKLQIIWHIGNIFWSGRHGFQRKAAVKARQWLSICQRQNYLYLYTVYNLLKGLKWLALKFGENSHLFQSFKQFCRNVSEESNCLALIKGSRVLLTWKKKCRLSWVKYPRMWKRNMLLLLK